MTEKCEPKLRRWKIRVVEHGKSKELLFQHGTLLFNQLRPSSVFVGGELLIYRQGRLLDKTERIIEQKDKRILFVGLKNFYGPGNPLAWIGARSLEPEEFQKDDRIVVQAM